MHLYLKSGDSLCKPKSDGGLGFRRFGSINIAFVLKLGWFLLSDNNLIWLNLIRAKYLRGRKLLNVQNYPDNASWVVQGIWKVKQYLSQTVCYKIGFKSDLNIFQDPWIPSIEGFKPAIPTFWPHRFLKVRDLMCGDFHTVGCAPHPDSVSRRY